MKNNYNCEITQKKNSSIKSLVASLALAFSFLFFGLGSNSIAQTVQIGSGSGTTNFFPLYYLYEKSYTQTIYTYDELTQAGMSPTSQGLITKVRYLPNASMSTINWEDWTIFLGNTAQDGYADGNDWIDISQMTQVFDGQIASATVSGQWLEITLDTPFQWDGTSNIVVAINQTTPDWGNNPSWASYALAPSSGSKGIYEYQDGASYDPANPPFGSTTNTVAQIQFDGNLMSACSGAPNAGVVADTLMVCVGQPFTLITTGSDAGMSGLSGQWQSRDAGSSDAWQDIAGATSATYTISSASATPQEYRYVLSCGSDDGYSNVLTTVNNPANLCPCVPVGTNSSYYIDDFSTTGGVQNISNLGSGFSPNGFGNFTTMTVEQMQTGVVNFAVNIGTGSSTFGFRIWVDWDQDGVFDPINEVVYQSSSYSASHSGSFTVPVTAAIGQTTMRIVSHYLSSVGDVAPCATNHTYGEFEDYTFVVAPLPPCTGMPDAGIVQGDTLFGACFGDVISLSVLGTDLAGNMTYQWQQRVPAGTGNWANISGANDFNLNMPNGITDTTEIRFVVTCNTTGDIAYSNVITITLNDYNDCYCDPLYSSGCSFGDQIDNFTLTGENGTLQNLNSGCSPLGYGDYTQDTTMLIPDLYIDSVYVGTVGTESFDDQGVRIWIDWNNNGIFEANEQVAAINNLSNSDSYSFTVPPSYLGVHRMRVRLVWWEIAEDIDPCAVESYGETEDYLVNIISAASCIAPLDIEADDITFTSLTLSWVDINTPIAGTWNIEYDTTGFVVGTGTQINGVTSPYNVTNLLPNTTYDFYVQSSCGAGDSSSWSGPYTVSTECADFAMPFAETFEDNSNSRSCWTNEFVVGQVGWSIGHGSTSGSIIAFPYEGDLNAVFYSGSGTNSPITKLVSPNITMMNQDSVALSFAYGQEQWVSDQNRLKVYAKTETDSDWIELAEYNDNVNFWTVETLYITPDSSQFNGNILSVAFEGINNYGFANVIDDVKIEPCSLTPGVDGSTDVCRLDNTIDLDTIVTVGETWGRWEFPANTSLVNGSILDVSTMASGTYEIYYIVKSICAVDTTVATITIYPPSSAGLGGTIEVCKGQPLDLFSALSGSVDMSGSWYDPNGNLLSNSQPNAPNLGAKYNYFYVASNGICPADTAIVEVVVDGTCDYWSVNEEAFNDISVYPNPTSEMVNIINPANASALRVEMLDMNGRIVLADDKSLYNVSKGVINVSQLETGIYTLRIYNEGSQKTFKIVKQ